MVIVTMIIFVVCLFSIVSQLEVRADDIIGQLSQSELEFGLNLFQMLSNPTKNTVLSPTSVYDTLLVLYIASSGETELELQILLGIDNMRPKLDKFKILDRILSDSKNTSSLKQLDVYNRIYIAKEVKVKQDVKKHFDELLAVFETDDNRADEVNKWISSKTHGYIKKLLEEGSLGTGDKLVFVNAAYLKQLWEVPFSGGTSLKPFTLNDESVVQVPLMTLTGMVNSMQSMVDEYLGFQAILLPYQGVPMSMVIVIPTKPPKKGSTPPVQELVRKISPFTIMEIMSSLRNQPFCHTDLLVPKFESGSKYELMKALSRLRGGDVLRKEFNLTNLIEPRGEPLFLTKAWHEVKMNVYENGTVAAAATAVPAENSELPCHNTVHADRPFIYFIFDEEHKVIHFIGTLNHPERH